MTAKLQFIQSGSFDIQSFVQFSNLQVTAFTFVNYGTNKNVC